MKCEMNKTLAIKMDKEELEVLITTMSHGLCELETMKESNIAIEIIEQMTALLNTGKSC